MSNSTQSAGSHKPTPPGGMAEHALQLLNIAATIFSIFFAVWWGLVATHVFSQSAEESIGKLGTEVHQGAYIALALLYAGLFTYYLTRLLWDLSRLDVQKGGLVRARDLVNVAKEMLWLAVYTFAAGALMWGVFHVPLALASLGGGLLLVWCVVSVMLFVWQRASDQQAYDSQNWEG